MSFHYRREVGENGKLHRKNGVGLGLNLENLIRSELLNTGAAIQMLSYIADALTDAHKNNHSHGDICVDDIKIDAYGAVLVNGFGRPRSTTSAPEDVPQGGSTDVYGLGVILLATLAGEESFMPPKNPSEHDATIVNKMIKLDWGELSEEPWLIKIQEFLIMALSMEPAERPNALDVANVLNGVLQNTKGPFLAEIMSENSGLFDAEEEYGDAEILEGGISELEPISLIPDSSQGAATGLWPREKILEMLMAEDESEEEPERKEWSPESTTAQNHPFEDDEPTVPDRKPIALETSQAFGNSTFQNIQFESSEEKNKPDSIPNADFNAVEDFPTDKVAKPIEMQDLPTSETFTRSDSTEPTQPKKIAPSQDPMGNGPKISRGKPKQEFSPTLKAPPTEQPLQQSRAAKQPQPVQHISATPPKDRSVKQAKTALIIGLAVSLIVMGFAVGWLMTDAKKDPNPINDTVNATSSQKKATQKSIDVEEDDPDIEQKESTKKIKPLKNKTPRSRKDKSKSKSKSKKSDSKKTAKQKSKENIPQPALSQTYKAVAKLKGIEGTITCGDGSTSNFQDRFSRTFDSRQTCSIKSSDGATGYFQAHAGKNKFNCTSDGVKIKCR